MVVVKKNNPSTFGASLDPLRASEHVKKNRVRFEQIQQAPLYLKEEHRVQLCPGFHSEHSLMDTRVVPIEHSQMDPTEGSRSTKRTMGCALRSCAQLFAGFVVWQIGNLVPCSNCTLYSPSITKWRRQRRNTTENKEIGTRKPQKSAEKTKRDAREGMIE